MTRGRIKTYKPEKGFGFIVPSDGTPDVFFFKTALQDLPADLSIVGREVDFQDEWSEKGPRAVVVRAADGE